MVKRLGRHLFTALVLAAGVAGLQACGGGGGGGGDGDNNPPPGPSVQKVSISGVVVGRTGTPIEGVTVTADQPGANAARAADAVPSVVRAARRSGSKLSRAAVANAARAALASATAKNTLTNEAGIYILEDVTVPADGRLLLSFEGPDVAMFQRVVTVAAGAETIASNAVLADVDHTTAPQDSANEVVVASVATGGQLEVTIPAGAIDGATGDVTVSVTLADPTVATDRMLFPGDFQARDTGEDNADTTLESVAFAEITIRDALGNEYTQLDQNKPATVRMRLPDVFQPAAARGDGIDGDEYGTYLATDDGERNKFDTPKNQVPWWSFNEDEGTWEREDADPTEDGLQNATVVAIDGVLYGEAKVIHFTWWNCDQPITTHAYLVVCVVDADNQPLSGVEVYASGVTYNGDSQPKVTDAQGKATLTVKRSSASVTEQVKVAARYAGWTYGDVTVDTPMDDQPTPMAVACLRVAFDGTVTGEVTNDDGTAAANVWVYTSLGFSAKTNASGVYSIAVPLRSFDVYVKAANVAGTDQRVATVTLTDLAKTATVNFQYPPMGFALALRYLEEGQPALAHEVLQQMEDAGSLDDRSRVLYALTTVLMLEDEANDPNSPLYDLMQGLNGLLQDNQGDMGQGGTAVRAARVMARSADLTAEQQVALDTVLVEVQAAQTLLAPVGSSVAFSVTIDGMTLQVDYADVLVLRTGLHLAEGAIEYVMAYDDNAAAIAENEIERVAGLTLATGAATHLANAKAAFLAAADDLTAAGDAMKAESDDQSDDLLRLDAEPGALWAQLKQTIAAVKTSISAGATSVPFPVGGDRTLAGISQGADGSVTASYTTTDYIAYVNLNLAKLFSAATTFNGASLAADLDSGKAEVAEDTWTEEWTDYLGNVYYTETYTDTYLWFDNTTNSSSYLAGFVTSVVPDALFFDDSWTGSDGVTTIRETDIQVPLRPSPTDVPKVDAVTGYPLDPKAPAFGANPIPSSWSEVVGEALAKVSNAITIDGDMADWGTAPAGSRIADGVTLTWAQDADNLYLLVRASAIDPAASGWSMGIELADEDPQYGGEAPHMSIYVNGGSMETYGSFSDRWDWNSQSPVDAGAGAGFVELAVPLTALSSAAGGNPVYVTSIHMDSAGSWDWWDASDWSWGVWNDFWGYRIDY